MEWLLKETARRFKEMRCNHSNEDFNKLLAKEEE